MRHTFLFNKKGNVFFKTKCFICSDGRNNNNSSIANNNTNIAGQGNEMSGNNAKSSRKSLDGSAYRYFYIILFYYRYDPKDIAIWWGIKRNNNFFWFSVGKEKGVKSQRWSIIRPGPTNMPTLIGFSCGLLHFFFSCSTSSIGSTFMFMICWKVDLQMKTTLTRWTNKYL